jgi:hypothetical protein
MITKEKGMKVSTTYRAESTPQESKLALRRLMQRLSLTLLASRLTIGATEAQSGFPEASRLTEDSTRAHFDVMRLTYVPA